MSIIVDIKTLPAEHIDMKVQNVSPKVIHQALIYLLRRIDANHRIYFDARYGGRLPLPSIIGDGTTGPQDQYLRLWKSYVHWAGLFAEHKTPTDIIGLDITKKMLDDVVIRWITASVHRLEYFMAQYPGENMKHISWMEKRAIGAGFSMEMLRVKVDSTTFTRNVPDAIPSKTNNNVLESCTTPNAAVANEDEAWEMVESGEIDKQDLWTMLYVHNGRARCGRTLFN